MKKVLWVTLLVLAGTVAYAAPPNSCDLHGTWVGEVDESAGGGGWLATYHGRTRTKGTLELQFLDVSANLGPQFDAERFSPTKGVWERTGRRSYVYTMVTRMESTLLAIPTTPPRTPAPLCSLRTVTR